MGAVKEPAKTLESQSQRIANINIISDVPSPEDNENADNQLNEAKARLLCARVKRLICPRVNNTI